MEPNEAPGEVLGDGPGRQVVRRGDRVHRPAHRWTPAVHALLDHLASVGFRYAPRAYGVTGGAEVVSFIPGRSGPDGWASVVCPTGLANFARLLRDYHDAVRGWVPPPGTRWATSGGAPGGGGREGGAPGAGELVCHGDFGPWNVVWEPARPEVPVGLIDWDMAQPAPALHDIGYGLEYSVPFRTDEEAVRWLRYPAAPDRRRRLEAFATAYGLTSLDGLVDAVAAQQRRTLAGCRALAAEGVEPQATWVRDGALATTEANIAWTEEHRDLFA